MIVAGINWLPGTQQMIRFFLPHVWCSCSMQKIYQHEHERRDFVVADFAQETHSPVENSPMSGISSKTIDDNNVRDTRNVSLCDCR